MCSSVRPDLDVLFSFTTGRWLCDDEEQHKIRYTPFNVEALEKIACDSVGAHKCLSWEKVGEGAYNKVFLLRLDTGAEIAIRIPCPIVGNVERSVASEVATMCYVRERWEHDVNIPLPPKVITWSASYNNPAKTPYIILDFAPDVPLSSRWLIIEGASAIACLKSIVHLENALVQHKTFSQHGSIYFAADLPKDLRVCSLYLDHKGGADTDLDKELSAKYRIGPSVNRQWWRGEYAHIDAYRGPWSDMQTMIESAAKLQLRALDIIAQKSSSRITSRIKSTPADLILIRRLLEMCILAAPSIIPPTPELTEPVLNHPDISLHNLLVPPEGQPCVSHVIDWQGATVSPSMMQFGCPPAVNYSGELVLVQSDGTLLRDPDNFDELTPELQEGIKLHNRLINRSILYDLYIARMDRRRDQVLKIPHANTLENLVDVILRCIADGPRELRGLLINLQENWHAITQCSCPIDFSDVEIAANTVEEQEHAEYTQNVMHLRNDVGCAEDLSVSPEEYGTAKEVLEQRRLEWDESAMKGPFPISDGAWHWYLT